jgi:RHS repeat-associated protein
MTTCTGSSGFTGRPYEFEFESYHYRNREINPILGRFAQRDPLEYIDGLNSYAYVNNNVVNLSDPSGLVNGWGVAGAIGGIIGNGVGFVGSGMLLLPALPQ